MTRIFIYDKLRGGTKKNRHCSLFLKTDMYFCIII